MGAHQEPFSIWGPNVEDGSYVLENLITHERALLPAGGQWQLSHDDPEGCLAVQVGADGSELCKVSPASAFGVTCHRAADAEAVWLEGAHGHLALDDALTRHHAEYHKLSLASELGAEVTSFKAYRLLLPRCGASLFWEDRLLINFLIGKVALQGGPRRAKLVDNERRKCRRHLATYGLQHHMLRGVESSKKRPGTLDKPFLPWPSSSTYAFVCQVALYAAASVCFAGDAILKAAGTTRAQALLAAITTQCLAQSEGFTVVVVVDSMARAEAGLGLSRSLWPEAPLVELDIDESGLVDLQALASADAPLAALSARMLRQLCSCDVLRVPLPALLQALIKAGEPLLWLAQQLLIFVGRLLESHALPERSGPSFSHAGGLAAGQREDPEVLEAASLKVKEYKALARKGKCRFAECSKACQSKALMKYVLGSRQCCSSVGSLGASLDASRLGGKDTLLGVFLEMRTMKAFYMVPQDTNTYLPMQSYPTY